MPYPVESRHKILQDQIANAEPIRAPAPNFMPTLFPGLVIDFIARSDTGYCLKVLPFPPKTITTAGELTFTDGSNPVPSNSTSMMFIPVYPIDVAPANVNSSFTVGQIIVFFPYWGSGGTQTKVRGTYVCLSGGGSLPQGEIQFQSYQMGSNNQTVWDFQRAHGMVT